jgi:hypothetical protein
MFVLSGTSELSPTVWSHRVTDNPTSHAAGTEGKLASVLDAVALRIDQGERVDFEELIRQHSELAEDLRKLLPTLEMTTEEVRTIS